MNSKLWLDKLEEEDIEFIRKFVLASGSLKELAHNYNVTYPTIRLRLDRVISKIETVSSNNEDQYVKLIKNLLKNKSISIETAKTLISEYLKTISKQGENNNV